MEVSVKYMSQIHLNVPDHIVLNALSVPSEASTKPLSLAEAMETIDHMKTSVG